MINRLIDTPYFSAKFVEDLDLNSQAHFNVLIEDLNCDPMNFLESLVVDPEQGSYDGIYLIVNYGFYLSTHDFYQVDYKPKPWLSSLKRYRPLSEYLDKLDFQQIEYIVFSHFTHKFDYSEDYNYNKNTVLKGIGAWVEKHPEDKGILDNYLRTKCLDEVFTRMINIKRRYVHE